MKLLARRPVTAFGGLTVFLVAALAAGSPAVSAADTTPPRLHAPHKSSWLIGSQVSPDDVPCVYDGQQGEGHVWVSAYQKVHWHGSDDSGSVRYSVVRNTKGEGPYGAVDVGTDTSFTSETTNSNNECGGGAFNTSSWDVTATDPSGNSVTRNVQGGLFSFTQNNNRYDDSNYAVKAIITYVGTWRVAHCTCWSDGSVHKTSAKASSATITFQDYTPHASNDIPVTHVGLVMQKGPDRGRFRVFVNGVRRTRVDLHAPRSTPRAIVWQAAVKDTDEVTIVNLATPGRQRVDLDGVLTN